MRAIYVDRNLPRIVAMRALKPVWPNVVFSPLAPSGLVDLGEPALPGPRFVRVRNRLGGICASDLSVLHMEVDPSVAPAAVPAYDRIFLGHEVVSEVVEVGPGVSRVAVGDRVIMDTRWQGATCLSQDVSPPCSHCAEGNFQRCENASAGLAPRGVGGGWGDGYTAHETEIYPVPTSLDDEQAMMVEPISTGLRAALRRRPGAGERALVVGAGIVGLNVAQSVKAISPDCDLTVIARHPHQEEAALRLGADRVVRGEDGYDAAARLTGGHVYEGLFGNRMLMGGFHVVYDCIGSAATLRDSLRWARAGGAVVMVGIKLAPLRVDLNPVWFQEVDLTGLYAHGTEPWEGGLTPTYDLVVQLLEEGKLTTEGLVTHRFPVERWRDAVCTATDKGTGAIKVAFDPASRA